MKTIIAGSRSFTDYPRLCEFMARCDWVPTEVISGCASGVDQLGERWAQMRRIPVTRFPADWEAYGRSAGPVRNERMANYADALVAVWDTKSKGTENMIEQARKRGLIVQVNFFKS